MPGAFSKMSKKHKEATGKKPLVQSAESFWRSSIVLRQVKLKNGGEIHARCFGRFNGTLWDDIFAELGPVTERDVIIVNFGAWYPRFNYHEIRVTQLNIYSFYWC